MTKEQADAALLKESGMDVNALAKVMAVTVNWKGIFDAINPTGVYYMHNPVIFFSTTWDSDMDVDYYDLYNGSLTIKSLSDAFPGLVFTRVAE